ncbi:MAG TPA: TlpA disulfide reductase family protein [Pyrinomonadaceae bacterium]
MSVPRRFATGILVHPLCFSLTIMPRRSILSLPIAVGIVLSAVVAALILTSRSWSGQPDNFDRLTAEVASLNGQPLPAHQLLDLESKEVLVDTLSRGRILLVFLTTSCDACIQQANLLSELQQHPPPNLRIYGVGFERPALLAAFSKEFDIKFPMLFDNHARLQQSLKLYAFPISYLIEDGIIIKAWPGAMPDVEALRRQIGFQEGK